MIDDWLFRLVFMGLGNCGLLCVGLFMVYDCYVWVNVVLFVWFLIEVDGGGWILGSKFFC